mgnify:CR=1 FL=1
MGVVCVCGVGVRGGEGGGGGGGEGCRVHIPHVHPCVQPKSGFIFYRVFI